MVKEEVKKIDKEQESSETVETVIKAYKIDEAIAELRKDKKRKFAQTIDLIINLQKFDPRKEQLNKVISVPHPSAKKVCAILTRKTEVVDSITESDFGKFKTPRELKNFTRKYDAFIAVASLMPKVATSFGRVLGPAGKMPTPQSGIIPGDDDASVKKMVEKISKSIKIRTKEKSIKLAVGKETMNDEDLKENIGSVYNSIKDLLPNKADNIKNVLIKMTMTKPLKLKI